MSIIASHLMRICTELKHRPLKNEQYLLIDMDDATRIEIGMSETKIDYSIRHCKNKEGNIDSEKILLDWLYIYDNFKIEFTSEKEIYDELKENIFKSLDKIQKDIDREIRSKAFSGNRVAMLTWLEKPNREGWGEYMSINGGYGNMFDSRTGNIYGVNAFTLRKGEVFITDSLNKMQLNFQLSIHIAVIEIR